MQNDSILSVLEKLPNWLNCPKPNTWRLFEFLCNIMLAKIPVGGLILAAVEVLRCNVGHLRFISWRCILLTFLPFLLVHLPNTFDYRRRLLIGTSRIFEQKRTERVAKIDNQCFDAGASFRKRWR